MLPDKIFHAFRHCTQEFFEVKSCWHKAKGSYCNWFELNFINGALFTIVFNSIPHFLSNHVGSQHTLFLDIFVVTGIKYFLKELWCWSLIKNAFPFTRFFFWFQKALLRQVLEISESTDRSKKYITTTYLTSFTPSHTHEALGCFSSV